MAVAVRTALGPFHAHASGWRAHPVHNSLFLQFLRLQVVARLTGTCIVLETSETLRIAPLSALLASVTGVASGTIAVFLQTRRYLVACTYALGATRPMARLAIETFLATSCTKAFAITVSALALSWTMLTHVLIVLILELGEVMLLALVWSAIFLNTPMSVVDKCPLRTLNIAIHLPKAWLASVRAPTIHPVANIVQATFWALCGASRTPPARLTIDALAIVAIATWAHLTRQAICRALLVTITAP
mmetsp:Transcript_45825/g.106489  ORF Transcript_45825/g.106489 Transcript_45825/m.106489 type:complete len:246 (-) Transcript_45825:695-1432(-)